MTREQFRAVCAAWDLSLGTLAKVLNRSRESIRSYRYRPGEALPPDVAAKTAALDAALTTIKEGGEK